MMILLAAALCSGSVKLICRAQKASVHHRAVEPGLPVSVHCHGPSFIQPARTDLGTEDKAFLWRCGNPS